MPAKIAILVSTITKHQNSIHTYKQIYRHGPTDAQSHTSVKWHNARNSEQITATASFRKSISNND